jgi:FkbM family methyltransferase
MTVSDLMHRMHAVQEVRRTYENWPLWLLSRMGIHLGGASTEIKVNGSKLLAPNNAESWGIADQVWRQKVYTKHFPILSGYRVLDVGAHFGFFSVFAALQNDGVNVVSYEPSKSTFGILKENLEVNLDPKSSFAFNFGLGDRSEESIFYKPEGHDASGTLFKRNLRQASSPIIEERVSIEEAGRIWDVFESYDFAKLDCEGAELAILQCLGEEVKRLRYITLEYHENPKDIARLLLSKNFSIVEIVPLEINSPWNAFSHMGMLYAKNDHFQANVS